MVALILLVLMGLFYSPRMIHPDTVSVKDSPVMMGSRFGSDAARALDKVYLRVTVAVLGLNLVYTLWSALVLTNGASGAGCNASSRSLSFQ